MAQNVVDFSGNPSGSGLMDDYLDKDQQNVLTSNSGIQRPSYAVAGTKWLDTSVTPWLWKMYDGTNDVVLGTVNPSTHLFTPANILPSQDGQSGKFLQTNGSNTLWTDAVDYTNITDCITAIPQDIKLEINNGNIVAADTCTVYKGDGSTYTIPASTNFSHATSAGTFMLIWTGVGARHQKINTCFSGSTAPAQGSFSGSYAAWYDTTNKVIKLTDDVGRTWIGDNSFPLCVYKSTGSAATSIDQVFNGFGYIGSTIFALPGVEGLIPNGRNADGSLNNIKFTVSKITTYTGGGNSERYLTIDINGSLQVPSKSLFDIDSTSNINRYNDNRVFWCVCGEFSTLDSRVTSFKPKTVFHAADYYDVLKLATDNTFTGINTVPTQSVSDNSTRIATTAFVNNKFKVVSTLPASPDASVYYFVTNA